jgi:hypothetical protein
LRQLANTNSNSDTYTNANADTNAECHTYTDAERSSTGRHIGLAKQRAHDRRNIRDDLG